MSVYQTESSLGVSADKAWPVLADFGNFLPWATGGAGSCRIEGEGIGMVRHLDIPGLGPIAERLDQLDHDTRTLGYTLLTQGMAGMQEYAAKVQVVADGSDRCKLLWHAVFEPEAGLNADDVAAGLGGSYSQMAQGLEAYAAAL